jgi:hypothetical protein
MVGIAGGCLNSGLGQAGSRDFWLALRVALFGATRLCDALGVLVSSIP